SPSVSCSKRITSCTPVQWKSCTGFFSNVTCLYSRSLMAATNTLTTSLGSRANSPINCPSGESFIDLIFDPVMSASLGIRVEEAIAISSELRSKSFMTTGIV
ncbi:hypothetical protein PMAYCL1PPCAC_31046, partial [Pristionchus mayeri]